VAAVFLFLCGATYRVMTDRSGVTYAVLAVGAGLLLYEASLVFGLAQQYLATPPGSLVEPSSYLFAMVVPGLGLGAGVAAIVASVLALPRRVDVAATV
jgi:hypothetical protein